MIIETLAAICQIHAGDTHQYGSTVNEIIYAQMECHAFYAKCTMKKDVRECMIERLENYKKKLAEQQALRGR